MKKPKPRERGRRGAVHEGVRGMHRLGLVDKKTMREFDLRCLTGDRKNAQGGQGRKAPCPRLKFSARRPRWASLSLSRPYALFTKL